MKEQQLPETPKPRNGHLQMIRMDKSTGLKKAFICQLLEKDMRR